MYFLTLNFSASVGYFCLAIVLLTFVMFHCEVNLLIYLKEETSLKVPATKTHAGTHGFPTRKLNLLLAKQGRLRLLRLLVLLRLAL